MVFKLIGFLWKFLITLLCHFLLKPQVLIYNISCFFCNMENNSIYFTFIVSRWVTNSCFSESNSEFPVLFLKSWVHNPIKIIEGIIYFNKINAILLLIFIINSLLISINYRKYWKPGNSKWYLFIDSDIMQNHEDQRTQFPCSVRNTVLSFIT